MRITADHFLSIYATVLSESKGIDSRKDNILLADDITGRITILDTLPEKQGKTSLVVNDLRIIITKKTCSGDGTSIPIIDREEVIYDSIASDRNQSPDVILKEGLSNGYFTELARLLKQDATADGNRHVSDNGCTSNPAGDNI